MEKEIVKKAFQLRAELMNHLHSYMIRTIGDYTKHHAILTIAVAIAYQDLLDANKRAMDQEEVDKFYTEIGEIARKVSKKYLEFLGE